VRHLEQALRAQEVLEPDNRPKRCDLLLNLALAQEPLGEPRRLIETMATPAYDLAVTIDDTLRASQASYLVIEALPAANVPTEEGRAEQSVWNKAWKSGRQTQSRQ
jgi:hypothetical protein